MPGPESDRKPTLCLSPSALIPLQPCNRPTAALTAEKSMGRLEDASTKAIDAKPFTVVARPGCARVFLPAAPVTSRHTMSGGSSRPAGATARGDGSTRRQQADAWGTPKWKR